MVITGGLTLIVAVAYWYVSSLLLVLSVRYNGCARFLFPDSPTNAWFLTKDERVKAVKRIKVLSYPMHSVILPLISL